MKPLQYKFYATLLDAFQGYLSSSEIYQQYWGFSEDPKISEEEFEQQQFQSLIDMINRVPFESEAADRGKAFNEVVDCIIEHRNSDKMEITNVPETREIWVNFKNQLFKFPTSICKEVASRLEGAITQQKISAPLDTKYGRVEFFGILDQLLPFKTVDVKTTKKYQAFKFRDNWQHKVYPYCLHQNQIFITDFEYLITDFKKVYSEAYVYDPERDYLELKNHCERFIEFLEANKELITDIKIFAMEGAEV